MLLNHYWVKEQVKEKLKRYRYTNENENMTYYNFWDAKKKAVLTGNSLIKTLIFHLKELEQEEQTKLKVRRRKKSLKSE